MAEKTDGDFRIAVTSPEAHQLFDCSENLIDKSEQFSLYIIMHSIIKMYKLEV
jgi:hypothetical protein